MAWAMPRPTSSFRPSTSFLLYYYTDVFGLAPAAVGTMFLVTKMVDAFSDPAMGLVADRTNTRWGKYRPYLLTMAIPYGLLGYAMFLGPDLSPSGKLVYAYITYSLMMLAYTAINIPYSALMGVISPSSDERVKVSAYRFVCAYGAGLVGPDIRQSVEGPSSAAADEAEGYRLTMMLFAVFSVAAFLVDLCRHEESEFRLSAGKAEPVGGTEGAGAGMLPWIALFVSGVFALMQTVAVRNGGLELPTISSTSSVMTEPLGVLDIRP